MLKDNSLAMIESHAGLRNKITQGYPLPDDLSNYFANLSFWFWSYSYICNDKFLNLDPLSMIDSITKVTATSYYAKQFLSERALRRISQI